MTPETKKRIAKEWLYFLGSSVLAIVFIPLLPPLFPRDTYTISKSYQEFGAAMFHSEDFIVAWPMIFAAYLLLQIVRSIVWAVRQVSS